MGASHPETKITMEVYKSDSVDELLTILKEKHPRIPMHRWEFTMLAGVGLASLEDTGLYLLEDLSVGKPKIPPLKV